MRGKCSRRAVVPRQFSHGPLSPGVQVGQVAPLLGDLVQVGEREEGGHGVDVLSVGNADITRDQSVKYGRG